MLSRWKSRTNEPVSSQRTTRSFSGWSTSDGQTVIVPVGTYVAPVGALTSRVDAIEPSALYSYSTSTRPTTFPPPSTSQRMPDSSMERDELHEVVPTGGEPALNTPVSRLIQPSSVTVPVTWSRRMTVP